MGTRRRGPQPVLGPPAHHRDAGTERIGRHVAAPGADRARRHGAAARSVEVAAPAAVRGRVLQHSRAGDPRRSASRAGSRQVVRRLLPDADALCGHEKDVEHGGNRRDRDGAGSRPARGRRGWRRRHQPDVCVRRQARSGIRRRRRRLDRPAQRFDGREAGSQERDLGEGGPAHAVRTS